LVEAVIDGVSGLPGEMWDIGSAIVEGVWDGICSAASWFATSVRDFFSGIVDGAKSALEINSPSKVFAEEVGEWIPPGIGKGIKAEMPDLTKDTQAEMENLTKKMKAAVDIETGTIKVKREANETYKVQQENGQSFDESKTEVSISGEIHTHVELDGEEVGRSQTPIVDRNMGRIDTHKKRGG
jgi:phage-related protein